MTEGFTDHSKKRSSEIAQRLFEGMVGITGAMVKEAQSNANQTEPNHPQVITGTLRRSIIMDVKKDPNKIEGKVGFIKGKEQGPNADQVLVYAPVIEAKYPFLMPAAESMKGRVKEFFKK